MLANPAGRKTRLLPAALSAAAVLAAAVAVSPAATAVAGTTEGRMTPAIGVHPHYSIAGRAQQDATTFSCQKTVPAGCYGPAQIRTAYGIDKVHADGAGQTIAIVDAFQSPTIAQDLATFDTLFGLPAADLTVTAPQGLTPFDQKDANQVGWAGEITLDVEWAHAVAPAAKLLLVLAKSNDDADIAAAQHWVVDGNRADVLSQSFGEAEQCMAPTLLADSHRLFAKAAAEQMTVLASSGDQGAAQPTCDGSSFFKAVSTPASDPKVTGVGGTSLDADGLTGAYHGESTWNEPEFASATGGGYSVVYGRPGYQASRKLPARGVPDVAYNAAIIPGVLTVWSTSGQGSNLVFRFGGTSAGSPQWAGLVALADQLAGSRVGFLNPVLYGVTNSARQYARLFHDVTAGDNTYHGDVTVSGYSARPGWDPATGLGSPKADTLVPFLGGSGGAVG
jgi:subtilase family serine protease